MVKPDIITFSNGEKLNPTTIEEQVEHHRLVKGTLVFGSGYSQAGLLVELFEHPKSDQETQETIDRIWPSVENVNKETVSHGQISREFIIFSNPQRPLPRGGKGSIQRENAVKLYQKEIDELYEKGGEAANATITPMDLGSVDALAESMRQLFLTIPGYKGKDLDLDTDMFLAGIDSLQVINASRLLRASLEAAGQHVDVPVRLIYSNPTLRRLATSIYSMAQDAVRFVREDYNNETQTMETFWRKYTKDLPKAREGRQDPLCEGQTVILTGSTGNLGSYILSVLAKDPAVGRVICLNRADDGGKRRQPEAMEQRGLTKTWIESKCTFLHADTAQGDFGLGEKTYSKLLKDADRFIHNAWRVNFNIPLKTFQPQLQGVRNIANFAAQSSKRVAVTFISSVSTVDRWDSAKGGPVPEERFEDTSLPGNGYGRSKMVASLILEDAAKAGDFPAAIIRVGLVAGAEADPGVWGKHELIPSVIASSLYLKALPGDLAHMTQVDWVPVEKIASMVLEVSGVSQRVPSQDTSGYFHAVNPAAVPWSQIASALREFYGEDRLPEVISFEEWVSRLEKSRTQGLIDANPGILLLDTFREMCVAAKAPIVLDMRRTLDRSPSMRSVTAITPRLMKHWCSEWGF
ncbi:male sterility protein-domain-containing protein [Jackrogersella minutella]|nr:male sterility protein-domain-containing protein [Jackrogersella minutella]